MPGNQPWSGSIGADWALGERLIELARAMDQACFDYVLIEDGSFVPDAYRGSSEWHLRNAATVPKLDPLPLVPLIGQATSHLGIVPTLCAAFYPPYLAARLAATLDHLTHGRVGLYLVTAHSDRTAQNFGLDRHYEHDLRYEMADEWMEVVDRLWESWEPDAIVADSATGAFADYRKVHPIDFAGRYYQSRGPLNAPPGPQPPGHLPGRRLTGGDGIRGKACRHDCRPRARRFGGEGLSGEITALMTKEGRDPATCKVMFCVGIILGETMEDARDKKRRLDAALVENIEPRLAQLSFLSGIDFSCF